MNTLMDMFLQKGFRNMSYIMFGTQNMFAVYQNAAYVISFIDNEELPEVNKEIYNEIQEKITKFFNERNIKSVKILKIILTDNYNKVEQLLYEDKNHWYITKSEGELLVLLNQPTDFLGIREDIENYLAAEEVTEEARARKLQPIELKRILTVTNILVAINILVFIITSLNGNVLNANYIHSCGGLSGIDIVEKGEWYRAFTSMFLHFGLSHLLSNMFMLFIIGSIVEKSMGKILYTITYFISGFAASLGTVIYYNHNNIANHVSAGASGAIFGILGALAIMLILNKNARNKSTLARLALYLLLSFSMVFFETNINVVAHFVGFVAGAIVALIFFVVANKNFKNVKLPQ